MNMTELRSLAKDRNLRGYYRLRKADLINLLRTNIRVSPNASLGTQNDQTDQPEQPLTNPLTNPLTKRQIKRRRNKASKLTNKAKNEG